MVLYCGAVKRLPRIDAYEKGLRTLAKIYPNSTEIIGITYNVGENHQFTPTLISNGETRVAVFDYVLKDRCVAHYKDFGYPFGDDTVRFVDYDGTLVRKSPLANLIPVLHKSPEHGRKLRSLSSPFALQTVDDGSLDKFLALGGSEAPDLLELEIAIDKIQYVGGFEQRSPLVTWKKQRVSFGTCIELIDRRDEKRSPFGPLSLP